MNWKVKAAAQNIVAFLPSRLSYSLYYRVQRRWGSLRHPDHLLGINIGLRTWRQLVTAGYDPRGKVFFEVGTGRKPVTPLAFWLMGAERIYTIDANPYLSEELTVEAIRNLASQPHELKTLLGEHLCEERLDTLVEFCRRPTFGLRDILELARIEYHAPGDAAATRLPAASIDVHTSYTVFEHIPREIILGIMREARRLLRTDGVALHLIDYTDHFCHKDPSIHWLNFLRYSDATCRLLFGNRYMYMNRLRHDDQESIGREAGFKTETPAAESDPALASELAAGRVKLAPKFQHKSVGTLSIVNAWLLYRPA